MGKWKAFLPVLFLATVGFVATDIYLPSFPAIADDFATTDTQVQLSFTLYLLTFSLSQLIFGPLSEKYGRKPIVYLGLGIGLVATALTLLSTGVSMLIGARMLQGVGLGVGPVLFRAILRDTYTGTPLAHFSSLVAVGTSCALALAPTIGGYIQSYFGWRANFVFVFFYILFGIFYIGGSYRETHRNPNAKALEIKTYVGTFSKLLKTPVFFGYALGGTLAFSGFTSYLVVSPFLFQDVIGLTAIEYGWLSGILATGLATGGGVSTLLVGRLGRDRTCAVGMGAMIVAGIVMFGLSYYVLNTLSVIAPMFLYIIGCGIVVGNCNAGAHQHFPKIAGYAGALYGTIQILGGSISTSLLSGVYIQNARFLSLILITLGVGASIFQSIGYRDHLKRETE